MDQVAVGAITAVWHDDADQARLWFTTIGTAYQHFVAVPDGAWSDFEASLRTAAASASIGDDTVNGFVAYVSAHASDPLVVARELGDAAALDEVVGVYERAVAAYAEPEGVHTEEPEVVVETADTVEFDQDAWFVYLAQWDRGWDGTDDAWPTFVSGFLHHAPDGSRVMAQQFIDQLEAMPTPERVTGLADFGITVAEPPVAEVAEDEVVGDPPQELTSEDVTPEAPEDKSEAAEELPDLEFDPAELMSELVDEAQLTQAVETGQLRFEPIEDDELDLESVA